MKKILADIRLIRMLRVPFGNVGSLNVYYQIKKGKGLYKVKLPNYNQEIYLREKGSDFNVFLQIFCLNDYGFSTEGNIKTIIDGGANIGLTAVYFSKKYPNAKIVCIEPDAENVNMIKRNTASLSNIIVLEGAIWNKETTIALFDEGMDEWGYITKEATSNQESKSKNVKTYTINNIMDILQTDTIDILKLDIEGSEKEVFEETYHTWLNKMRYIIIELHDRLKTGCTKNLFKAISEYNFSSRVQGEHIILKNEEL